VVVVVVGVIVTVVVVVTVVVDVVVLGVPAVDDGAAVAVEVALGAAALDDDAPVDEALAVDSPSECASPVTVVVAIAPTLVIGSPPSSVWNVASGNAHARAQSGAQATTTRRATLPRCPRASTGSRAP
jgi:hypothetical protein